MKAAEAFLKQMEELDEEIAVARPALKDGLHLGECLFVDLPALRAAGGTAEDQGPLGRPVAGGVGAVGGSIG